MPQIWTTLEQKRLNRLDRPIAVQIRLGIAVALLAVVADPSISLAAVLQSQALLRLLAASALHGHKVTDTVAKFLPPAVAAAVLMETTGEVMDTAIINFLGFQHHSLCLSLPASA